MKKRLISWPVRASILLIVSLVVAVLGILWWNDGVSPIDRNDETSLTFTIQKGESVRSIASRLSAERLIRSKTVFFLLVKLKGIDDKLQAGDFRVKRTMGAEEISDTLTHGAVDIWITTLEGWRDEEIATKLTQELKIPEQEFIAAAEEGYMFPDTYLIPRDASAAGVVSIFRSTFEKKITPQMRTSIAQSGLTMKDIVTLASLVEREGRTSEDRPVIAGILLNRLKAKWPLDVDATLQYALGYDAAGKTWWKKELTDEDKKIDSPYNTYKTPGLPPGPIANPGLVSLMAAINPTPSEYFFYLHDPEGRVHYAKTLKEHEANIQTYLR